MKNVEIFCGDCVSVMSTFDANIVDLTVTSPPYDTLRNYQGSLEWNYDIFKNVAQELYRITANGGIVVWVVGDATFKGSETGSSFKQALYFKEVGFNLLDTMIWRKTNPMPQVKQPRYSQEFEYMFVFSKGKPKSFNPIMVPTKCGGQRYNSTCKNMGGENGRVKKDFCINSEKVKGNVWDIAISSNKTNHPAVFPLQIPFDHILSWTNEGDLVFDPFLGSGTTGIAAVQLKRKFIGVDKVDEYCIIAKERIDEAQEMSKDKV